MENIKIIDNFLDEYELKILTSAIKNKQWKYNHSSGGKETIHNKFFVSHNDNDNASRFITEKIKSLFPGETLIIKRQYVSNQLFGQDGGYHVDGEGNENKTVTFCLYLTDVTNNSLDIAGGDFFIKIPNCKFIISIKTIMNRGILFPSNFLHKGNAYTKAFYENRLCLTCKIEII